MQGGSGAPTAAPASRESDRRDAPGGRAVVVGSGSAGRRHTSELRRAAPALRVALVRRAGRDGLHPALSDQPIHVATSLAEALQEPVTVGVVAGPAPTHEQDVLQLIEHGAAAVLVEKPISTDPGDPSSWRRPEVASRVVVGYHLRFGDVLPAMQSQITAGAIGELRSFTLRVGQHLSQWRPGTEPSESVSARRELGGGVLLELSHEIDAVRALFRDDVTSVRAARLEQSGAPTDGVVETEADLELVLRSGLSGTVHLDMTSEQPCRTWQVAGDAGTLHADLLTSRVVLERPDGTRTVTLAAAPGERDRAEQRLMAHVLSVARGDEHPACTVDDGLQVLAVVHAARRCAATGGPVQVVRDGENDR